MRVMSKVSMCVALIAISCVVWGDSLMAQEKRQKVRKEQKAKKAKKAKKVNPAKYLLRANRLASAGALKRSIPHYNKAIKSGQEQYPIAHFNLGEVYKAQKKCGPAVLHYQAFLALGQDADTIKLSKRGVRECARAEWQTLSVQVEPVLDSTVLVDGNIVALGKPLKALTLASGRYDLEVRVRDYITHKETIKIQKEPVARTFKLERQTFFGTAKMELAVEGARVSLEPKLLDKVDPSIQKRVWMTPIKNEIRLPTGKYFLEVKKKGYDRWIRNIYVRRDSETLVQINLTKSLPSEIQK